jgi:hypothetical protein
MRQKLIVELLTNRSNINGTTQVRLLFFYDISAQTNDFDCEHHIVI